jgi:hypothetical protein
MLPPSDWGSHTAERKGGTSVKTASLHRPFDNPTNAVREHGRYGGQGKAAGAATLAALLSEISRIIGEGALSSLYVGARLPITMDSR